MDEQRAAGIVRVWDPLVRVLHWSLVVAFAVAYLVEPEDGAEAVHEWAGYVVGGLVAVRVLWGFVGPRHARFADFVYRPATVLGYLRDLIGGRARRYLGHSPAGGAMAIALLVSLAASVATGVAALGAEEGRGPMAALFAPTTVEPPVPRLRSREERDDEDKDEDDRESEFGESLEELHEVFSDLALILVIAHIGGVALASFVHRENLPRAMVTGNKRPL